MKSTKTLMTILTLAVLVLSLSLAFAVPSGAITPEASARYLQEAPSVWGDDEEFEEWGASAQPYRILASAALSDILPVNDIVDLEQNMDTVGRAPVAANFTDAGYRDDTIIVEIEEIKQDNSTYHVAYVKIATPSQLRTVVAGGTAGNRTMPASTLAKSVNAIVAVNGDFYSKSTGGYIVRQGETLRKLVSNNYDLLAIDENGDFHLMLAGKTNQKNAITTLMEEHEIINAFFFGPALVMDGNVQTVPDTYGWNPFGKEPRAAIGQIAPLTYAVVTVDGRIADSEGVTLPTLASFMEQIGCKQAYNLDGGNSSALVYNNKLLSVKDVEERSLHDIIYFASATQQGEQ